jgi:hypothetical protein
LRTCKVVERRKLANFGPFWPLKLQTAKTMPTPTFVELFVSQKLTNGNTRFLKGVPIDGNQKALVV